MKPEDHLPRDGRCSTDGEQNGVEQSCETSVKLDIVPLMPSRSSSKFQQNGAETLRHASHFQLQADEAGAPLGKLLFSTYLILPRGIVDYFDGKGAQPLSETSHDL